MTLVLFALCCYLRVSPTHANTEIGSFTVWTDDLDKSNGGDWDISGVVDDAVDTSASTEVTEHTCPASNHCWRLGQNADGNISSMTTRISSDNYLHFTLQFGISIVRETPSNSNYSVDASISISASESVENTHNGSDSSIAADTDICCVWFQSTTDGNWTHLTSFEFNSEQALNNKLPRERVNISFDGNDEPISAISIMFVNSASDVSLNYSCYIDEVSLIAAISIHGDEFEDTDTNVILSVELNTLSVSIGVVLLMCCLMWLCVYLRVATQRNMAMKHIRNMNLSMRQLHLADTVLPSNTNTATTDTRSRARTRTMSMQRTPTHTMNLSPHYISAYKSNVTSTQLSVPGKSERDVTQLPFIPTPIPSTTAAAPVDVAQVPETETAQEVASRLSIDIHANKLKKSTTATTTTTLRAYTAPAPTSPGTMTQRKLSGIMHEVIGLQRSVPSSNKSSKSSRSSNILSPPCKQSPNAERHTQSHRDHGHARSANHKTSTTSSNSASGSGSGSSSTKSNPMTPNPNGTVFLPGTSYDLSHLDVTEMQTPVQAPVHSDSFPSSVGSVQSIIPLKRHVTAQNEQESMSFGQTSSTGMIKQRYPSRNAMHSSPNSNVSNTDTNARNELIEFKQTNASSSSSSSSSSASSLSETPVPTQMARSISGRSDVSVRFSPIRDRRTAEHKEMQYDSPPRQRSAKTAITPWSPKGEENSLELGVSVSRQMDHEHDQSDDEEHRPQTSQSNKTWTETSRSFEDAQELSRSQKL